MYLKKIVALLILTNLFLFSNCQDETNADENQIEFNGPYLGMSEPGNSPVQFAPDFFRKIGELHTTPVFTPNGKEMYYSLMGGNEIVQRISCIDNLWTDIEDISFLKDCRDISISNNGKQLIYFKDDQSNNENIWIAERVNESSDWMNYTELNQNINQFDVHWGATISDDNTLFFGAGLNEDAPYDIYYSKYLNGEYQESIKLGAEINTPDQFEDNPFIAPDGSYLLFTRSKPDWMQKNIYISFYDSSTKSWSQAQKLPYPINTGAHELSPRITPDGKYFFFLSERSGKFLPYWMNANFLNNKR